MSKRVMRVVLFILLFIFNIMLNALLRKMGVVSETSSIFIVSFIVASLMWIWYVRRGGF